MRQAFVVVILCIALYLLINNLQEALPCLCFNSILHTMHTWSILTMSSVNGSKKIDIASRWIGQHVHRYRLFHSNHPSYVYIITISL